MFYSAELLSRRRRGKLAQCWLAATVSEKMFKTLCRPNLIEKIDVYHTCEEILLAVEIRNKKSYGRFSLYLSSQLMYGATKILFYQTRLFQDYLFGAFEKTNKMNRSHEDFLNTRRATELPDVPDVNEVFRYDKRSSNLHLIMEEPYISVLEHTMQDEMNFGALTNYEMEKFLFLDDEGQSLNEIRQFRWDESEEPIEDPKVPLVDVNQLEMETIEAEKETRLSSARRDQREALITIGDDQPKRLSRKRALESLEETPSKKRKVSPEEKTIPEPVPVPVPVPVPEPVPEVTAALQPQQALPDLENEEPTEVTKPIWKRKFHDKRKKLSGAIMQKWIRDVTAHTIPQHLYAIPLPSATEHFARPSTMFNKRPWGISLKKFFEQCCVEPSVTKNEFEIDNFDIEDTLAGETVRAETSSKLRDQTAELSSQIATSMAEVIDQFKALEKMLPAVDFSPIEISEPPQRETKESEESVVELPDITNIDTKIRETSEQLKKLSYGKKLKSSCSSSDVHLIKPEILALMEVQWPEKNYISFHELISPENYSKKEAARAFYICLEFHAEKVVILKQADPFSTIWIEKYPRYDS